MSTYLNDQIETAAAAAGTEKQAPPRTAKNRTLKAVEVPRRSGAQEYDALLWRLCAQRDENDGAGLLLGLTGCGRQAGVSTLATNLAIRAADLGLGPVLLVDANLERPQLHRFLRVDRGAGLAEALSGQATLDACLQGTLVVGLDVLPSGASGRAAQLRVEVEQIDAFVAQLREQYSIVICDLPEAHAVGPALLLARALDASLLVVRAERATRNDAQQATDRLQADGVNLVGAVITDERRELPGWLQRLLS